MSSGPRLGYSVVKRWLGVTASAAKARLPPRVLVVGGNLTAPGDITWSRDDLAASVLHTGATVDELVASVTTPRLQLLRPSLRIFGVGVGRRLDSAWRKALSYGHTALGGDSLGWLLDRSHRRRSVDFHLITSSAFRPPSRLGSFRVAKRGLAMHNLGVSNHSSTVAILSFREQREAAGAGLGVKAGDPRALAIAIGRLEGEVRAGSLTERLRASQPFLASSLFAESAAKRVLEIGLA